MVTFMTVFLGVKTWERGGFFELHMSYNAISLQEFLNSERGKKGKLGPHITKMFTTHIYVL